MYNEHFGLTQAPFRITPDTGLFYTGGGRGDVLDALVYAVTTGEGIVKVVGEVGTGKTMLCRMLEERLPDNVQIAYLANPSLTPEDILHAVALELGLELPPQAPRLQVMHRLQQALLELHAENRRVVALVEEAQSMPVGTLEEIRLLSNLETKNEKLLQIILFGQPELDDNLALPEIRQLRERITHSFQLKPLGVDEIKDYVAFRLRASGYRGRDAFTRHAYRAMSRASEGLTRRVNIIADKAMLAAYAEDTHDVSAKHVKVAIQDSEFGASRRPARTSRPVMALAGVAAAAVLAGTVGWYAGIHSGGKHAEPGSAAMESNPEQASRATASMAVAAATVTPQVAAASPPSPQQEPSADGNQASGAEKLASAVVTSALAAAPETAAPAMASRPVSRPQERTVQEASADVRPGGALPARGEMPEPATRVSAVSASATPEIETVSQIARKAADTSMAATTPVASPGPAGSREVSSQPQPPTESAVAAVPEQPALVAQASEGQERKGDSPARSVASTGTPVAVAAVAARAKAPQPVKAAGRAASTARPAQRSPGSGGLLDQRLDHTEAWLGQVNRRYFSIQLLATDATRRGNLEAFLERRDRAGQLDQVFVYRTRINERLWFGVLYGEFPSFSEAREALDSLPRELTRHQPFIRNIRDISVAG
jgi:type II secretory pathway predicted ATPase ExeA